MVAVSLGFKAILNGVSALAASALRLGKGGILSVPFNSIALGLATGALIFNNKIIPKTGNQGVDLLTQGLAFAGEISLFNFFKRKFFPEVGQKASSSIVKSGTKTVVKEGTKSAIKNVGGKGFMGLLRKLAVPLRGKGGAIGAFLIDFLIFGEDLDRAIAGAAGFFAGAKVGAAIGASIGALFGGVGAGPGGIIGGIIGGFIGGEAMKSLLGGIKRLFGFKTKNDDEEESEKELNFEDGSLQRVEDQDVVVGMRRGGIVRGPKINKDIIPALLTPGEFIMTRETTDRIGASFFEALNKGGMVDKSITPVNKMEANNVAEKVSSLEEGAAEIVTFPMAGQGGSADATSDGSGGEPADNVPNIGFNDNNIHTLYASSMYGANA